MDAADGRDVVGPGVETGGAPAHPAISVAATMTAACRSLPCRMRATVALAAILEVAEQKAKLLQHQAEADRDLSASLAYEGS